MEMNILILAALSIGSEFSWKGKRLYPIKHPFILRIHWGIIGAALSSTLMSITWPVENPISWIVLVIFLVTCAKTTSKMVSKVTSTNVPSANDIEPSI